MQPAIIPSHPLALDHPRLAEESSPILGNCKVMRDLRATIRRLAASSAPVLLLGETGTGKNLVAQAIHQSASLRRGRLVAIDCGALPDSLLESELFGHVKGAFTGADRTSIGLLASGHGGTVFLDEIGDLPLSGQSRLLRVLQEREIRPVGAVKSLPLDIRVIAATHCDLEAEVEQGRFRLDLYYRLNVIRLKLPPLRERREDIPPLVEHFLGKEESGHTMSREALSLLQKYPWPGNVRELNNCITALCVFSEGREIQVADLPDRISACTALNPKANQCRGVEANTQSFPYARKKQVPEANPAA